jgi:hypothetical protein
MTATLKLDQQLQIGSGIITRRANFLVKCTSRQYCLFHCAPPSPTHIFQMCSLWLSISCWSWFSFIADTNPLLQNQSYYELVFLIFRRIRRNFRCPCSNVLKSVLLYFTEWKVLFFSDTIMFSLHPFNQENFVMHWSYFWPTFQLTPLYCNTAGIYTIWKNTSNKSYWSSFYLYFTLCMLSCFWKSHVQ